MDPVSGKGTPTLPPSDEQLVERFAAGQQAAVDELFRRHWPAAYALARRLLGEDADAQDAAQDGFVKALGSIHGFRRQSSFRTWLLRVVTNEALNLGRKARRKASGRLRAAEAEYARSQQMKVNRTPLDELMEEEEEARTKALYATIQNILELHATDRIRRMRLVCKLRIAGWAFAQIAEELKVCETTARLDVDRLRALVLRELTALGVLNGPCPSCQRRNP